MKDYHIKVFYSEDEEGYIAGMRDVEHCSAFGGTTEEGLREVPDSQRTWLDAARASVVRHHRQCHSRAAVSSSHLSSRVGDGRTCETRPRSPNVRLLPLSRPHVEGNLPHVMGARHR